MKFSYFLLLAIAFSCTIRRDSADVANGYSPDLAKTKLNALVLVDANGLDRCGIGELIGRISLCHPKVIGLNFILVGDKTKHCDSVLSASISASEKVILAQGFEEGKVVGSNDRFEDVAFLASPYVLVFNENDVAHKYLRLLGDTGRWTLTFPFLLALQYDKTRAAELSAKVAPGKYPIYHYYSIDEFDALSHETNFSKECSAVEGKIVLIGDLSPAQENMVPTRVTEKSSDSTNSTVILANIILDILTELD